MGRAIHVLSKLRKYTEKNTAQYEINSDFRSKMYNLEMVTTTPMESMIQLSYIKQKLPPAMFSCTTEFNDVFVDMTVSFKVHNRVFINFTQQHRKCIDTMVRKVYIVCNIDRNMDSEFLKSIISNVQNELVHVLHEA